MPPEPVLRTFIAIELDPETRDALSRVQGQFKRGAPEGAVKWVNPDSIHLTLKFLGDTPVSKVSKVADAIAAAREGLAAFDLSIEGRGCFPNFRRPRVVWVAVKDLSGGNLTRLQAAIERLVSPLGFPTEERDFSPHLSLGRIARNVSPAAEAAVGKLVQDSVVEQIARQRATAVSLIKSDLRSTGPVYYTLATAKLGE
jgi:RNA 2',3'-cyclic 3'-phosphodiesterase